MQTLIKADFKFPGRQKVYHGKVREVYTIDNDYLMMVVTDRISAFDVVLPRGIPYKGQVLNQIASKFLEATKDIVPNWMIDTPDPNVTFGYRCDPYPVEMIVRGYLTGSSWRTYKTGAREICGVPVPEEMKEHQAFPEPIITPTTKADQGLHDEDISRKEIIEQGLVDENEYRQLEEYSLALFKRGSEIAAEQGLILVDTKYEFGRRKGDIYLIDEIHTPDSSRYFYADGYTERLMAGEQQKQLSKEFVREWLMDQGFSGQPGKEVPLMSDDFVNQVSARYIELYEKITGDRFIRGDISDVHSRITKNITEFLQSRKPGMLP